MLEHEVAELETISKFNTFPLGGIKIMNVFFTKESNYAPCGVNTFFPTMQPEH